MAADAEPVLHRREKVANEAMVLRRISQLVRLTHRQHAFLLQGVYHLARARIDFSRKSASEILEGLQRKAPNPASVPSSPPINVETLSWAVKAAAAGVPWRSDCLIQSMAADRWLRRHGIVPDFRLGVSPSAGGALLAHAWVEVDGKVMTGGDNITHYEVLIAS